MKVHTRGLFLAATTGLALVACGGDDATTPVPAPAPAPTSITIAGTAVKGVALGGAAVSVKCAAGTGATTSAASGAYTVTLTNGALPCAVKVVGTDGTTYHSLVAGTGNTGTFAANASPLTEMVVSHAAGMAPDSFYNGFASTSTVSAASVTAANSYVQTAMAGLTNLAGVNSLTDPLVVGNALDQKIDAVVAGLAAAGVTVAQVTTSIVANPAAPSVVAAPLAPSATACAWLKSGKYRVIDRTQTDPKFRFESVQINATTLTVTDQSNVVLSTMTSDGSCQFNINETDATLKVLVSSGGMVVIHAQSKLVAADRALILGVPEQTLPVSELAGTWNLATWEPVNIGGAAGSTVATNDEITVDATGQVTATKECLGLNPCTSGAAPFAKFVANATGGFDVVEGGAVVARIFVFKTLAGKKVAVALDNENTFTIAVPKEALVSVPAVGTVSNYRLVQINGDNSITPLTEDSNTITASDSVTKTATRIQASNNRVDTLTYDKPRDGLRYRAANSCTIAGVVNNCAEIVQLPLQGMGITLSLSAVVQPTPAFYQFAVGKP
jgi:hypothetical protein